MNELFCSIVVKKEQVNRGCKTDCVNAVLKKEEEENQDGNQERVKNELIVTSGSALIGPDGLVKDLTKALVDGCWPVS